MSGPFDSLDEARMRILGQWEYEGRLDPPLTLDTLMALRSEIMQHRPDSAAAVFPWSTGGSPS